MESTPLYNRFLEAGRQGLNDGWRYILGFFITVAGYFVGSLPLVLVIRMAMNRGALSPFDPDLDTKMMDPNVIGVSSNMLLFLELLIFVGAMIALWLAVTKLHRKPFTSIITSAPRIRWKRFFTSFGLMMIVQCVLLIIMLRSAGDSIVNVFDWKPFLGTLVICLLFLPVQTWWEEFFLRGYALQGIGIGTRSAWAPLLITSVVFGLLHMFNPEVKANGAAVMLPQYIMPGLVMGLMTVLDEGQELAMGFHLANNLFGAVMITSAHSAIRANTIFFAKVENPTADLISGLILNLVFIGIFWLMYRWDIQKLYRKT